MKKKLLLLSMVQIAAFGLYAQQTKATELKPLKAAEKSTTTSSQSTPSAEPQPVETLVHLNAVIDAIDSKVAYIKSDQTENQKAIESGWYELMAKQRALLVVKKEALLQQEKEQK